MLRVKRVRSATQNLQSPDQVARGRFDKPPGHVLMLRGVMSRRKGSRCMLRVLLLQICVIEDHHTTS